MGTNALLELGWHRGQIFGAQDVGQGTVGPQAGKRGHDDHQPITRAIGAPDQVTLTLDVLLDIFGPARLEASIRLPRWRRSSTNRFAAISLRPRSSPFS